MRKAAERMKDMRTRRQERGLRELRLVVPDATHPRVRSRIAAQVAQLRPESEADALDFIESVGEFDAGPE